MAPLWQTWTFTPQSQRATQVTHAVSVGGTDVTSTYTYDTTSHALKQVSSTGTGVQMSAAQYDPAGSLTSRTISGTAQTSTTGAMNRVTTMTTSGTTTSYVRNPDATVLIRRDPTKTVLFLGPVELTMNNGTVTATRSYTHTGVKIAERSPAGVTIIYADPQGTATVAVDWTTLKGSRRYHDPYGNILDTKTGTNPWNAPTGHGYLDKPLTTLGLTDMGAREYDPVIGHFTTLDPILNPQDPRSHNGYSYTSGDPVNTSDPTGLRIPDDDGAAAQRERRAAAAAVEREAKETQAEAAAARARQSERDHLEKSTYDDDWRYQFKNVPTIKSTKGSPASFRVSGVVPQEAVAFGAICTTNGPALCLEYMSTSKSVEEFAQNFCRVSPGSPACDLANPDRVNRLETYRHFTWQVELAARHGNIAAEIMGYAHEAGRSGTEEAADTARDLVNNSFARNWFARNGATYADLGSDSVTKYSQLYAIAEQFYNEGYFARVEI